MDDRVDAGVFGDRVVRPVARELDDVGPVAAIDLIVSRAAGDQIVAIRSVDDVVAVAAGDGDFADARVGEGHAAIGEGHGFRNVVHRQGDGVVGGVDAVGAADGDVVRGFDVVIELTAGRQGHFAADRVDLEQPARIVGEGEGDRLSRRVDVGGLRRVQHGCVGRVLRRVRRRGAGEDLAGVVHIRQSEREGFGVSVARLIGDRDRNIDGCAVGLEVETDAVLKLQRVADHFKTRIVDAVAVAAAVIGHRKHADHRPGVVLRQRIGGKAKVGRRFILLDDRGLGARLALILFRGVGLRVGLRPRFRFVLRRWRGGGSRLRVVFGQAVAGVGGRAGPAQACGAGRGGDRRFALSRVRLFLGAVLKRVFAILLQVDPEFVMRRLIAAVGASLFAVVLLKLVPENGRPAAEGVRRSLFEQRAAGRCDHDAVVRAMRFDNPAALVEDQFVFVLVFDFRAGLGERDVELLRSGVGLHAAGGLGAGARSVGDAGARCALGAVASLRLLGVFATRILILRHAQSFHLTMASPGIIAHILERIREQYQLIIRLIC